MMGSAIVSILLHDRVQTHSGHGNADALSRLPLASSGSHVMSDATIYNTRQIASLPLSSKDVEQATRRDPILGRVLEYTQKGWPGLAGEEFKAYYNRKDELAIEGDRLLWGARVVLPTKLRDRLLKELHQDHPGVSRMKAIARSYLWWPGLDSDLEKVARSCLSCQAMKHTPAVADVALLSMAESPYRLRRIVSGEDVPVSSGRSLQVGRAS